MMNAVFRFSFETICCSCHLTRPGQDGGVEALTLIGAVGMGLIAVIPAVIIPVAGPVVRDAAAAVTLKLST